MGEIVNLGRARKRRVRAGEVAAAQQNRVRFGRTAAEKRRDARAEAGREASLDGKRREDPPDLA